LHLFQNWLVVVDLYYFCFVSFQDAHLQPEFQLSGGERYSTASAVLGGMVAPPPSSFGVNRPTNDRDAIFGGPMSPQQRNPVAGPSYLDSEDKRMDGSEEFIDIKARLNYNFYFVSIYNDD